MKISKMILLYLIIINLFSAQGQSQITIEKKLLNDLVRTAEKLHADNKDLLLIQEEGKLIIETQKIRIIKLESTVSVLENSVQKVKIAYNDLQQKNKKKRFWIWLKGVATGTVIGGIVVVILLI